MKVSLFNRGLPAVYLLHLGLLGDLIQSIPIAPTWRCRMRSNTDVIRGITKINVFIFCWVRLPTQGCILVRKQLPMYIYIYIQTYTQYVYIDNNNIYTYILYLIYIWVIFWLYFLGFIRIFFFQKDPKHRFPRGSI